MTTCTGSPIADTYPKSTSRAWSLIRYRYARLDTVCGAAEKALDFNLDVKEWAENLGDVVEADCKGAEETLKKHLGMR